MFHIKITEEHSTDSTTENATGETTPVAVERYSQRVDAIDLQAIIIAVNKGPKKVRSDLGTTRKPRAEAPK